jgi:hypothetical protein
MPSASVVARLRRGIGEPAAHRVDRSIVVPLAARPTNSDPGQHRLRNILPIRCGPYTVAHRQSIEPFAHRAI